MSAKPVELTIPGSPEYLRLVRLVATSMASLGGFDVEGVDDVRIAVDELCTLLIDRAAGAPVELTFEVPNGEVHVRGRVEATTAQGKVDETTLALSHQILAAVADHYEVAELDGTVSFSLAQRRGGPGSAR
jgi:serine/threonine-protein kinase RsbW